MVGTVHHGKPRRPDLTVDLPWDESEPVVASQVGPHADAQIAAPAAHPLLQRFDERCGELVGGCRDVVAAARLDVQVDPVEGPRVQRNLLVGADEGHLHVQRRARESFRERLGATVASG